MKKAINIRMDENLLKTLDEAAKELDRSRTWLIEQAVSAYMDRLDEIISDKRLDDIKNGKETLYSLKEVREKLGLENV
ncbi:ribbon-helix-helix protein, CopG family [Hydrogenimonas urashimensis]|uniref:ribbon-helix-helix protein, CopG family n=1 Tax=Hydrogenimonas urashimensis TaxID=2740515 RepID=UPI0019163ECA|nr:ribbon-helix-helix protein, CopG family [Hydrogenimonas urashimensis]